MAAPAENQNAVGNKGPGTYTDRRKAAQVRNTVMQHALDILLKPRVEMNAADYDLWKETYLKLLPTCLPRLQELTGEDGMDLKIIFDDAFKKAKELRDNNVPSPEAKGNSDESGAVQGSEGGEKKREDNV